MKFQKQSKMLQSTATIFAILYLACAQTGQQEPNFFQKTEKKQAFASQFSPNEALAAAIADCSQLLEKAADKKFKIGTEADADVFLTLEKPAEASEKVEKQLDAAPEEAFFIFQKSGKTKIYARRQQGLSHGLYFLLEKLGFRFYLPHEIWTVSPKNLKSLDAGLELVTAPDLKVREFFGSGGYAVNRQVDPNNARRDAWELWKTRNRMGGNRKIWGHQGYDFNQQNRAELEKHPEYLAEIGGKRIAWTKKAKWCVSNEGFVQLFVEDRLKEFEKNVAKFGKDSPEARSIGVEPTDGGGHCTCAACEKMGSVSNRMFYLANRVGEIFEKKHPGIWVSILAYNFHGDTPELPLRPNVDVCIIPSGFHDVAPGPAYIEKWQRKLSRPMGLYDYWAIPLWGLDVPRFGVYNAADRLAFWQSRGVDAVLLESSYSQGSIGLPLYLMARLGWDKSRSGEQVLSEFYENCFPNARRPMERMFLRQSNNFMDLEEVAFSLHDILEAKSLARTDLEKQRVEQWAAYIHYFKLILEFKSLEKRSDERIAKADAAIEFLWKIHSTFMVHSTGVQDAITHQHEKNPDLQRKWTRRKNFQDENFWQNLKPIGGEEIWKLIEQDKKEYPLAFDDRPFSNSKFQFVDTAPTLPLTDKSAAESVKLSQTQRLVFYSDGKTPLEFSADLGERGRKNRASAMITSPDGSRVFYFKNFLEDSTIERHSVRFEPPAAGFYFLTLTLKGAFGTFSLPQNLPMAFWGYPSRLRGATSLFLPVPKSVDKFAFQCRREVVFRRSDGSAVAADSLREATFLAKNLAGERFLSINPHQNPAEVEVFGLPALFFFSDKNFFLPVESL